MKSEGSDFACLKVWREFKLFSTSQTNALGPDIFGLVSKINILKEVHWFAVDKRFITSFYPAFFSIMHTGLLHMPQFESHPSQLMKTYFVNVIFSEVCFKIKFGKSKVFPRWGVVWSINF